MKYASAIVLALIMSTCGVAIAYPVIDLSTGAVRDSAGYPSWGADISVSVTAASTTTGTSALAKGFYVVVCTTMTHVDQGTGAVVATTSERTIPANTIYPLKVTGASDEVVAWIRDSADGTCILSNDTY